MKRALPIVHADLRASPLAIGALIHGRDRRRSAAHALRSSEPPSPGRRSTLAREKNTSRAEARRRTRVTLRADQVDGAEIEGDEGPDFVDSAAPPEPVRKPLFKMPNIREDLRALPSIIRSRPILFLPLVLLLVGLGIFLVLPGLAPDIAGIAGYYIQFFFAPPALFTFFIAGFFAPRASYLIGFIYGLIAAVVWSIAILVVGRSAVIDPAAPQSTTPLDTPMVILNMLVIGVLYGTLAGALAGWYREFLRGIQERGKARRAVKEVDERARRREERAEARRVAKRPTS